MEDPLRLLRRLRLGREEYCQRLMTMLILDGPYPAWNSRNRPSSRGVRFLRSLDVLSFGGGDEGRPDRHIRADLGEGLGGRLIRTGDAAYMRMAGEEPAPGKPWEKITAEREPYNLFVLGMVTGEAMKLVDSHRVHGMLAARGQVSGPVSEGGLDRYTVAVDVRAALDGLDLAAFLDVYDPLSAMQDTEDEYERVRAGDPAAQARLRGRLIEEFGERATYELWIDGEDRRRGAAGAGAAHRRDACGGRVLPLGRHGGERSTGRSGHGQVRWM
ncbi:hypothetical protein ACIBQ6_19515 [Nonomuraea sp. NPDC049655]|uniref:hypothetical protein n=1 Tax=Nonomuraea sp. NPDC049655 TaxID=3364355 RepID=UPI0037A9B026